MSIKNFRDRDFAEYCEYIVAFKLEELGWEVYQPLSDRYIDIVAVKKIDDNKKIIRTIQVKGSRLEKEGKQETYGLTHKPKDMMHDPSRFFIWVFFDQKEEVNFIVLSVSDFIRLMGKRFFTSLSWRKGNCRIHFHANEKKLLSYTNNWDNLIKGGADDTYSLVVNAQETNEDFKGNLSISKWKEANSFLREIPNDMLEKILRKTEI